MMPPFATTIVFELTLNGYVSEPIVSVFCDTLTGPMGFQLLAVAQDVESVAVPIYWSVNHPPANRYVIYKPCFRTPDGT